MPTILVTGGGRGIGRAIALSFSEPGSTVAVAARTRAQLNETAVAIRARGATPGVSFEEFRATALDDVPIKRIIQPDGVAALVTFLASPIADHQSPDRRF